MKRRIATYIILVAVAAIAFASCEVESEESRNPRTQAGVSAFNYAELTIITSLRTLDMALDVNSYLTAATQEEKDNIEDKIFPAYKIRQSGTVVSLTKNNGNYSIETFEIETGGLAADKPNAQWSITHKISSITDPSDEFTNQLIPNGGFTITCSSENTWHLKAQGLRYIYQMPFDCDIIAVCTNKRDPKHNVIHSDYELSGSGKITGSLESDKSKQLTIDYTTTTPVQYLYSYASNMPYIINEMLAAGTFNINIYNPTTGTSNAVKAELTPTKKPDVELSITYRGVTEILSRYARLF